MSKIFLLFLSIIFLVSLFSSAATVSAQTTFTAFAGAAIPDSQIDGVIGSEWNDAGVYPKASIFGNRTAELWLKHDENYLYIAYRIVGDSNNPWSAIQFTDLNCMANGADGALFGHDSYSTNGYVDISFGGMGLISVDTQQSGTGAFRVEATNITVELKKPLNSGDTDGKDVVWLTDRTYTFRIIWDSNGGGSSGGSTSHQTTGNVNIISLSTRAVPEIPVVIVAGFLVASAVIVLVLGKSKRRFTNHATSPN